MAAPYPRLRKYLSASGLLKTIRQSFEAIVDHRTERSQISLPDALVSGRAVFGLKYPSLLKFLVHPQRKTVLPLAPEVITRQDGATKNDCERNASKRLLRQLRQDYPQLKLIIVEDSLASNGPHLELLHELDLRYLIGVKESDHAALFEAVQAKLLAGEGEEFESTDEAGVEHLSRFVNDLPLNHGHPDLRVNFL